jgi:hypothetical protein
MLPEFKMAARNGRTLELRDCDDRQWDALLANSQQSNIFMTSEYLHAIGMARSRKILFEDGLPVLGSTAITTNLDESDLNTHSHSTYQSIFFPDYDDDNFSRDLKRIRFLTEYIEILDELQLPVILSIHPSIQDIRGIIWHFHENATNLTLDYQVRYTGIINLQENTPVDRYLSSIRKVRIQEYRKSKANHDLKVCPSNSSTEFTRLYRLTFEKQGLYISDAQIDRVQKIVDNGISNGFGTLYEYVLGDEKVISSIFILNHDDTDYYQLGANDPAFLHLHGSTRLLIEAITESLKSGKKYFDMVGVNSPGRGEFKASFNARPYPYFLVTLSKNN